MAGDSNALSQLSRWATGAITLLSVVTTQFFQTAEKKVVLCEQRGWIKPLQKLKVKDMLFRLSNG